MCKFVGVKSKEFLMRIIAVLLSVVLLSVGWLGVSGLPLLVAFVPLLWLHDRIVSQRTRPWWAVFRWSALTFILWNIATVWWIWNATPVGPIAATLVSTTLNLIAFMLFHKASMMGLRKVGYILLVAGWIATEYWYTEGDISWPWLVLGNGFSHDVWAVQWYEFTGVFGGSLWALVSNILIYEAIKSANGVRRWIAPALWVLTPLVISVCIYTSYSLPNEGSVQVATIQPNIDNYDKFNGSEEFQRTNILNLMDQVSPEVDFILLPETSIPDMHHEPINPQRGMWGEMLDSLRSQNSGAQLIAGATTVLFYDKGEQSPTSRRSAGGNHYDIFNSAIGLDSAARVQLHHKTRLVIGVEKLPLKWLFGMLKLFVIDLGGISGQLGESDVATVFTSPDGVVAGPAICYEGLYGNAFGEFVRNGAQIMFIISNDGWWGDTPGYKHLFSISQLRAIEHRRAVVRSANTGISGFITPRGDRTQTLGWDERGVLTEQAPLSSEKTIYTTYGDYIARVANYVMILCVLYLVAYTYKRKNYLVK